MVAAQVVAAKHRIAYSPFASFVGSGEFSVSMNGALFVAV